MFIRGRFDNSFHCSIFKFCMIIYIYKYNRNTQESGPMICISRLTDFVLSIKDGWIMCNRMSFLTVFQSYQQDWQVIMKGCVL